MTKKDRTAELAEQWFDHKSMLMEKALGKEHGIVMHALIPYAIGGNLDLYYYPNGIRGTAIATKELTELPNKGPSNRVYRSYELVMFTKRRIRLKDACNDNTAFGRAHRSINAILEVAARYCPTAKVNPNDTSEFPAEMEIVGGKCLIFDGYRVFTDCVAKKFGLLLIMEVFRSEMEFARKSGGHNLIRRLKSRNYYPYSDMDRKPVA